MMARVPLKLKIASSGHSPSHTLSNIEAGGHRLIIDEPVERGGTGKGATPLEVLMSSLVGCTNVISNRIASKMNIGIESMEVSVVADLDARVLGGEQTEVAFPEVRITVNVVSDSFPDEFAALREELERTCPVSVLFIQAGTRLVHDWTIAPTAA
jgi:putative redox protein